MLEIIDQSIRLTQSSVMFWEIVKRENMDRFPELRGKHVAFFEPVQFFLGMSVFVVCYQLFDTRSDSKHIHGLINEAEKMSPKLAAKWRARIDAKKTAIDKMKKLRSKVFAHRDRGVNPNQLMQQEGVVYKEIREVVEMVQDVVSDLAETFGVRGKGEVMQEFASFGEHAHKGCVSLFESVHPPMGTVEGES